MIRSLACSWYERVCEPVHCPQQTPKCLENVWYNLTWPMVWSEATLNRNHLVIILVADKYQRIFTVVCPLVYPTDDVAFYFLYCYLSRLQLQAAGAACTSITTLQRTVTYTVQLEWEEMRRLMSWHAKEQRWAW